MDSVDARLVLLVGDSAGNVVFGYETTIPVTVDDLIPVTAAPTEQFTRQAQRQKPPDATPTTWALVATSSAV
jgi:3-methyl-2-oxobutanoate hydroxymethyltransferase